MERANILVLLLSQDYLASTSCREEMEYAISVSSEKRVISVILRDCTWLETQCKELTALPKNGLPVAMWPNSEDAWHNVFDGIKAAVEALEGSGEAALQNGQPLFELREDFTKELLQIEFVAQAKERPTLKDVFLFPVLYKDKGPFDREPVGEEFFTGRRAKSILIRGREFRGRLRCFVGFF